MRKINIPLFAIAILAVFFFMLVGVAIGYRAFLVSVLFLFMGFATMGFGFTIKRKQRLSKT
ncbi:DUF5325 family protein [Pontibacillus salicampi]|uniref:DUF5325 family protein n=1 Tax=Pontibacillus salicampi TaxID=1449801 RepID=A0ABV6LNN9_9BACI